MRSDADEATTLRILAVIPPRRHNPAWNEFVDKLVSESGLSVQITAGRAATKGRPSLDLIARSLLRIITFFEIRILSKRLSVSRSLERPIASESNNLTLGSPQPASSPIRESSGTYDVVLSPSREDLPLDLMRNANLGAYFPAVGNASGRYAGFDEVLQQCDETQFRLFHLATADSEPNQVCEAGFATQLSLVRNQQMVLTKGLKYLEHQLLASAPTNPLPLQLATVLWNERCPSLRAISTYFFGRLRQVATRWRNQRRLIDDEWGVLVAPSRFADTQWDSCEQIVPPSNCYVADPFIWTEGRQTFCFVEEYDKAARKGRIAAYELSKSAVRRVGVALEEDFHLSFPYLFRWNERLFMLPETLGKREVRLYEAVEFPLKWEFVSTLLQDVKAVDSLLWCDSDGAALLTTIDNTGFDEFGSELYLFRSEEPLSNDWQPSSSLPILSSSKRGRNAGLITRGVHRYRVSQGHHLGQYGSFINIESSHSSVPSPADKVCRVNTHSLKLQADGIHHATSDGLWSAVDFWRAHG